jgi:hypothetical protein
VAFAVPLQDQGFASVETGPKQRDRLGAKWRWHGQVLRLLVTGNEMMAAGTEYDG